MRILGLVEPRWQVFSEELKQENLKKTISMSPELIEELERRRHEWGLRSKGEVLEHLLGWMLEKPAD